jgi:hypothetical protein
MDANIYLDPPAGTYAGQTLTFQGKVLTNTLVSGYTSVAFIKDFVSDYSSFVSVTAPLTPGPFSISYPAPADPTHHIQYGLETMGPDVWITDHDSAGSVTLTAATVPVVGDYNQNGVVDAADYTVWRDHLGQTFTLPNRDPANGSGPVSAADYTSWITNFGHHAGAGAGAAAAVPEPSTLCLGLLSILCLGVIGRRGR